MPRAGLILALWALGCAEEPKRTVNPAPASAASAASPISAAPGPDLATRRARFEARPIIQPLAQLPARWRALPASLGGRLISAGHEVRSRTDSQEPWRRLSLRVRLFGEDAAVDAAVLGALKGLGLPGMGAALPEDPVEVGPIWWAIDVARVKGESPRESQYEIRWRHRPPAAAEEKECRSPTAVDLPAEAPDWLEPVTNARSTRRRISARIDHSPQRTGVELRMLYRNGYALDEAVGHFTRLASRRGYTHKKGEGPNQLWLHPSKAQLRWQPDTGQLHLGCRIAGTVLRLSWSSR